MIRRWLKSGFTIVVYLYLYIPMMLLVVTSFNATRHGTKWSGFSWIWYQKLWLNQDLLESVSRSVITATVAATMATLMGTLAAVALYRYSFPGKRLVHGLLFTILVSPEIVMAISLLALFILVKFPLGFWSLLCAHTTTCLPFVVTTIFNCLKGFDKKMLEAARDLGAGEWTTLRTIILPLALPAIAAGWLLSFTISLDDVVISSFIGGPSYEVLPVKIYSMIKVGVSPEVNALTTVMLSLSLLLGLGCQLLLKRSVSPIKF